MPRNDSLEMGELTDTSYYILLSLVQPRHGYLIMQTIEEMTDRTFSIGPASMYTTIKKLQTAGLIKLFKDDGGKRKTYVATEAGINLLQKEVERKKKMIKLGESILNGRGERE